MTAQLVRFAESKHTPLTLAMSSHRSCAGFHMFRQWTTAAQGVSTLNRPCIERIQMLKVSAGHQKYGDEKANAEQGVIFVTP